MYNKILFCFLFIFILTALFASGDTTDELERFFDYIEQKTDSIDAVAVNVVLTDSTKVSSASLIIKNPDKFAIEFKDGTIKLFYNGCDLWIYIDELKEAFYHKTDSKKNFLPRTLDFISPKKIFVKVTRTTLTSLFDISIEEKYPVGDDTHYLLLFKPRFLNITNKIFESNSYLITFSHQQGLPIEVEEKDKDNKTKTHLKVLEYKINEEIKDTYFNFKPEPDVFTMPLTTVIAQKIEQYADEAKTKAFKALDDFKTSIWSW